MSYRWNIVVSGLIAAGLIAGCSSGDPLSEPRDAGDDDATVLETSYGALSAQVQPRTESEQGPVDIQAQFLDARGVAVESALQALEVWVPHRGLEQGECRRIERMDRVSADHQPVSLHLIDVGDIVVETTQQAMSIQPRQMPDLLSSFYGVIYGSEFSRGDDDAAVGYHPGELYRFSADGSSGVGGFDVAMEAPRPMVLVAANGEEIEHGQTVTVSSHQDLELVWESRSDESGEVFIDLAEGGVADSARIQCRTDDDGAFSVPSDQLGQFGDDARMEVRRVHRTGVDMEGLDDAEFYFATTDRIRLHLR